jgi:hypothetical protein
MSIPSNLLILTTFVVVTFVIGMINTMAVGSTIPVGDKGYHLINSTPDVDEPIAVDVSIIRARLD